MLNLAVPAEEGGSVTKHQNPLRKSLIYLLQVLVLLCCPSLQQAINMVEFSISALLSSQWSSEDTCEETLLPGAPPPTGASGS